MKKFNLVVLLFCMLSILNASDTAKEKFEKLYSQWEQEIEEAKKEWEKTPTVSCVGPSNQTKTYYTIISHANIYLPFVIEKIRKAQSDWNATDIFAAIMKIIFENDFVVEENKILLKDYGFKYTSKIRLNDKRKFESPYLYWWDEGRKLTPELFAKKYSAYEEAKKGGDEEKIKNAYTKAPEYGRDYFAGSSGKNQGWRKRSDSDVLVFEQRKSSCQCLCG